MNIHFLTDYELNLLDVVEKAVAYDENGDPIKDAIEDYQIIDALVLLLKLSGKRK